MYRTFNWIPSSAGTEIHLATTVNVAELINAPIT